jgi:uncharacterized repeat protein (TIGR03847 family)
MERDIELQMVDGLGTGAIGEPGAREFFIQARTESAQLTVLVEKEQVRLLAAEAVKFLDNIAANYPEPVDTPVSALGGEAGLREPAVPLFRARMIGLGYDPEREMVLIELRERSDEDDDEVDADDVVAVVDPTEDEDGFVARIYATRPQVRALAARGAEAVAAGRPSCPLCDMPMDPAGHRCPRWN